MNARAETAYLRLNLVTLAGPLLIVMIIGMMMLPLPPLLLDFLFTFNIALSIIIMLVAFYTLRPLEFSAFPTILLVTTLLRLSLNVASARVVLMEGHTGPDAAGKVIEAFGHFLIGGNYAVGIIVFAILVIINFIVITKGAGRIAEVSARFTLDAMPGKQLSIDADQNAGLISEEEARSRRDEVAREAEFFGAMDGASKFVRGDAVAAIIIVLINIVGGLAIGMFQHDLDFATAANNYTLLTIGDGLVAQIPALMISTAAGIMVSRVATEQDVGQQLLSQLFARPQAIAVTAAVLGLLGIIPGMPHIAFLTLAVAFSALAWTLWRREADERDIETESVEEDILPQASDIGWEDVAPVDILGLEVGFRLIPLVDRARDGELLRRIFELRKTIAQERGFLVPAVHIRDNLQLRPNAYRILLKGVPIASGEVLGNALLAVANGAVRGEIEGQAAREPATGKPALWIGAELRERAKALGYTIQDSAQLISAHLSRVIATHAAELLGREETLQLLARVPSGQANDLVPGQLQLGVVQKVLQNLLEEGVAIRDLRTIFDVLADQATRTQDADQLTAAVRAALARSIVQDIYGDAAELPVIVLDAELERTLEQSLHGPSQALAVEPGVAAQLLEQLRSVAENLAMKSQPLVVLVAPELRLPLARFLRRALVEIRVLSHNEIPESRAIRISAVIGGANES